MKKTKQTTTEIVLLPSHIKVYGYVKDYFDTNMYGPELTEIEEGVGLTGRQCFRLVTDLVEIGALIKIKNKRRGLKLGKDLKEILSAK